MKKYLVIIVLFALPLVAYLFFASGVNNFARLPVLDKEVADLEDFEPFGPAPVSLRDSITILGFPGRNPASFITNAYHLAEKIYEPYHEFRDFQFVFVVPPGEETAVSEMKQKLSKVVDLKKWKFIFGTEEEIHQLFSSLNTEFELNEALSTPHVFILDKNGWLRGRKEDEDGERLSGYDSGSIAVLNNKMDDDVKVILAEYRLELKKYNKQGEN